MLNIFTFEILNAMVTINHRKIGKATAVSLLGVPIISMMVFQYVKFGMVLFASHDSPSKSRTEAHSVSNNILLILEDCDRGIA